MNPNLHPVDVASKLLGGQAGLAIALGVSRGAVPQWKQEGRTIPLEHCPKIERLTGGKVTCEQLRPDFEWAVLRKVPKKARATKQAA